MAERADCQFFRDENNSPLVRFPNRALVQATHSPVFLRLLCRTSPPHAEQGVVFAHEVRIRVRFEHAVEQKVCPDRTTSPRRRVKDFPHASHVACTCPVR